MGDIEPGAPRVDKDEWIRSVVKGQTFADVGGLWRTVNEKVSFALEAGATAATMIDVEPMESDLWAQFKAHCAAMKVTGYECVEADATASGLRERVGVFDVVHCSGVIYHVPDLVGFLRNLAAIARKHLIVTSMIFPPVIENEFGTLDLRGGHCMFVPLMSDEQRKIAAAYASTRGQKIAHLNGPPMEQWIEESGIWDYAGWVWMMTAEFLLGLAEVCGLRVIKHGPRFGGRSYSILCQLS